MSQKPPLFLELFFFKQKKKQKKIYMAASLSTLGYYWGGGPAHPTLITAFFSIFDPRVDWRFTTRLGP